MKLRYVPILALSLGLAACASQVPVATTYPISFQKKMQAAHHWDLLAADLADRLQGALSGLRTANDPLVLHVRESKCCTTFSRAFHELLVTHLMNRGFGISRDPAQGLTVEYDIQVVTHNDRGFIRPPPGFFSSLAALSGGLYKLVENSSEAAAVAVGAVALDVGTGYITDTPHSEIILTTSVSNRDRFVTRTRDIYYISDNNIGQYVAAQTPPPTPPSYRRMEVVGP